MSTEYWDDVDIYESYLNYHILIFLFFIGNMYLTFSKNDGDVFGLNMNNKTLTLVLFCVLITIIFISANIASLDDTDEDTAEACIYMGMIIPSFFVLIYLILFGSSYYRKRSGAAPAGAVVAAPAAAPAPAPAPAAPAKTGGGRYRKTRTRSGK